METMIAVGAATVGRAPWWVTAAVGVAGALATLAVAAGGAVARERNRRRARYAAAVEALIGWLEYPYQIRRRTSDSAEELARLRDMGHELQKSLEYHQAMLSGDSKRLGDLYGDIVGRAKSHVGPWITEAWNRPPVTEASGMVLDGWGPERCSDELAELREAIGRRFGWRWLSAVLSRKA